MEKLPSPTNAKTELSRCNSRYRCPLAGLSQLPHPLSSAKQRPLRDTASPTITGGGAVTRGYVLTWSCLINCLRTEESYTQFCLRGSSWPAPVRRWQSHSLLPWSENPFVFLRCWLNIATLLLNTSDSRHDKHNERTGLPLTQNDGENQGLSWGEENEVKQELSLWRTWITKHNLSSF